MGGYERSREGGFRTFAMAFWDEPRSSIIYGNMEVDVHRSRWFQDDVEAKFGVRPSMGQLVGRGVAEALLKTPEANAKIIWGRVHIKKSIDVYFQVDVGDGADLSGVTIYDTGNKSIVDVAEFLKKRADKLRKGKDEQYEKTQKGCLGRMTPRMIRYLLKFLTFCEYNLGVTPTFLGARPEPFGTVMVTNVSMFGIDQAYAPLIPVARVPFLVLVGRVVDRPWVLENGELGVRPIITINGTFDHRVVDGNRIGRIVRAVKAYMEDPYAYETSLGLESPAPGSRPITRVVPRGAKAAPAPTAEAAPEPAAEAEPGDAPSS
jgi:pyruvate/2-oxoglutarate dehydrogenase complex dihydrolipoamide acyltransferase (E2) component